MRDKTEATDIVPVRSATPTVDPLSKGESPRLSYGYVEEEGELHSLNLSKQRRKSWKGHHSTSLKACRLGLVGRGIKVARLKGEEERDDRLRKRAAFYRLFCRLGREYEKEPNFLSPNKVNWSDLYREVISLSRERPL